MNLKDSIFASPPGTLPRVSGCEALTFLAIQPGVQAIIHVPGSDSLVVIANPDNGDSPTIYERHGFDEPTEMQLHTEEVEE